MQGQVSACLCVQAFTDQPQSLPDNPSNTGQLAAGVAGLLAVPVVAWSEYILKTTGKRACQAAFDATHRLMLVKCLNSLLPDCRVASLHQQAMSLQLVAILLSCWSCWVMFAAGKCYAITRLSVGSIALDHSAVQHVLQVCRTRLLRHALSCAVLPLL